MSLENKTNFVIAVQGYKRVKKEKTANFTDVTAIDALDKKVLLRIMEPIGNEYISLNDVQSSIKEIKRKNFDHAVLISKKFTANAIQEMRAQKIQHVADDYMPPFGIEALYLAIVNNANDQCQKTCGKLLKAISDCTETKRNICKVKTLAQNAKAHFEQGSIGLLKNDLKVALALNQKAVGESIIAGARSPCGQGEF